MSTSAPQGTSNQQPTPRIPRPAGILALSALLVFYGIGGAALSLQQVLRRSTDVSAWELALLLVGLVLGSLYATAGVGLFSGRRWAHRATLALLIFSMLLGGFAILFGGRAVELAFNILVSILITYYLITPEAYAYFGQD